MKELIQWTLTLFHMKNMDELAEEYLESLYVDELITAEEYGEYGEFYNNLV